MMNFKINLSQLILLCISFIATSEGTAVRVSHSDEYRLRRELFSDNDVMVRPVLTHSAAVNVSFSLVVSKLMDLDNKRQVLITRIWISQKWNNPFLTWKDEDYGGLYRITVRPTEIWVPDIILYNNGDKQVLQAGHTEFFKSWVVLYSNGTCLWDSPAIVESRCDVDVSSFPFDTQECHLIFASGTYDSKLLDIHSMRSISGGETSVQNITINSTSEWEVEKVTENIRRQPIQRHPGLTEEYVLIWYTVVIQRRSLYYVMYLIIPCVLCMLLVLVSFEIPPENGERIGFCSTIMVAVSVYLLLIADLLPEKSDTLPILGIYYTMTMLQIALALMATVLVLRVYHSTGEPPACIKALMCKVKKNRNQNRKEEGKIKKLFKRNTVSNEMIEVQNSANITTQPMTLVDSTQPMQSLDENEANVTDDKKTWRTVAVACDRVFFWLFLFMFIGSTGYLIKYYKYM